jgi:protein-S-isoprenylcysteine O-methyltransferase Ste14
VTRESWRRFAEFLPEMRRPWIAALVWGDLVLAWALALALGTAASRALPLGAVLVQSGFVLWAAAWMRGFWRRRSAYRERYGAEAYRYLFFRFLLPAVVGAVSALCFPALVAGDRLLPRLLAWALAAYLLASMLLLELRGREVFWDLALRAFVYSVFPERGRILTSGLFAWLGHPVYSAAMRFAFALAALRNNGPAFLCAALVAAGLWLWSRQEEEALREVEPSYGEYRERVPAFFVPQALRFWRFLVTGSGRAG